MGHYPDCPGYPRRCSSKRTFTEPYSYRQSWCQISYFSKTSSQMLFWKYGSLSGLSRVPSGMYGKEDIFIPTGNIGVIFMFFKDKYVNGHFKYFESKDHYCTRYSRGCSIKRTFAEPCSYRYYWYQIDRTFKIQSLSVFGNTRFWKHLFPILATIKKKFLETTF